MSFTMNHCLSLNEFDSLMGKPLVVKSNHGRPFDDIRAVFLCLDEHPENGYLRVIGTHRRECSIRCDEVLGVLKKEFIPTRFKSDMAGIQLTTANKIPAYFGYSMDEGGYHLSGTPLADIHDVEAYVNLQKDIQHELRITDTDDCLLLKIVEGELIFPYREMQEQSNHVAMAQAM